MMFLSLFSYLISVIDHNINKKHKSNQNIKPNIIPQGTKPVSCKAFQFLNQVTISVNYKSLLLSGVVVHSVASKDKNIGFDGYIGTWILRIYRIYRRYIGGYFYINIDISEIKLL